MSKLKERWPYIAIAVILIAFVAVAYHNKEFKNNKVEEADNASKQAIDKELGYTPEDYIKLGQYKGIAYNKSKVGVSDEELQSAIADELLDYKKVDRASKNEDSLNINYTATVDGKKDDNLSEDEYEMVLGEQDLDEKFDEELTGKKAGDVVNIELSDVSNFPMDDSKDYSGKKVSFEIKVNSVNEPYTDKLTDEWVKENYGDAYDCTNVKEFKKMIKESLLEDNKEEIEDQMKNDLWQKAIDNCDMNGYPQSLYDNMVETDDANIAYEADQWGMTIKEYYEYAGLDDKSLKEMYLNDVKAELVMWAIVKKEGLSVTQDEIEQGYNDMYEDYDYDSVDAMKAEHTDDEIKHALLEEKVIDIIVDKAVITEVESVQTTEAAE